MAVGDGGREEKVVVNEQSDAYVPQGLAVIPSCRACLLELQVNLEKCGASIGGPPTSLVFLARCRCEQYGGHVTVR